MTAVLCFIFTIIPFVAMAGEQEAGNVHGVVSVPVDHPGRTPKAMSSAGGPSIQILDMYFGAVGTAAGMRHDETRSSVKATVNGREFELTGANGGIKIIREIVFLVFKDIDLSVHSAYLAARTSDFLADNLGRRLKVLQEGGKAFPTSRFDATQHGNTTVLKGTLVVAVEQFDEDGQMSRSSTVKAFLPYFAVIKSSEGVSLTPDSKSTNSLEAIPERLASKIRAAFVCKEGNVAAEEGEFVYFIKCKGKQLTLHKKVEKKAVDLEKLHRYGVDIAPEGTTGLTCGNGQYFAVSNWNLTGAFVVEEWQKFVVK
jgi:hypothetical protein